MVEERKIIKFGDLLEKNIRKKSINDIDLITFIPMEYVSEEGKVTNQSIIPFHKVKKGLTYFERNDIIVAKITPCFENGKGACLDDLKTDIGFGSTEFHVLRAKKNVVPRYIYYHTQSKHFRKNLEKEMTGSAGQKRVPLYLINEYTLAVDHLYSEQRAIAEALSNVDNLIASLGKLIDKKQKIKQGAMQELLTGKKRLPGFTGEWEKKKIGEVAVIFNGGTPRTSNKDYWGGEINWCTPTDITNCKGKYILKTEKTITVEGLNSCSATLLPKGTLLLCSRATIGEVRIAGTVITTNQGFKSLICDNLLHDEFLYYYLQQLKELIVRKAAGSTFLEISKKDLSNLDIFIPCIAEQKTIAQILADMDSEIEALEEKLDKYKAVKQGMMQELLTGRIRLV